MALCGLLTIMVLLASTDLAYSTGLGEPDDSIKSPGCMSKDDCGRNEYCGGRSPTMKRCIDCFDCSAVQRKAKRMKYDGPGCAEHQSECGECNEGYRESGGWCHPIEPHVIPSQRPTADTGYHHQSELGEDAPLNNASNNYLVVGLSASMIICLMLVLGISGACYSHRNNNPHERIKRRTTRGDEETALYNTRSFDNASAPPAEEYRIQPPSYDQSINHIVLNDRAAFRQPVSAPWLEHARNVAALPFTRGNGAGSWMEGTPVEQSGDRNADVPVDGAAHEPLRRTEDTPDSPVVNINSSLPASNGNEQNNQVPPHLPLRSSQNTNSPVPFTSIPTHPNAMNNPVVGSFNFAFFVRGRVPLWPGYNPSANSSAGPANSRPRMAISAPASPRRIDDTHLENLTELRGDFTQSDTSMDSGTGTGEHERSVPSASASFGDVHDSFYDDDYDQPNSPDNHIQPPAVPDIHALIEGENMQMDIPEQSPTRIMDPLDEFEE